MNFNIRSPTPHTCDFVSKLASKSHTISTSLAKAFTSRFYTRGMSGERVFKVTDPLIAANEAPFVFRLVDGRAETRPATSEAIQVETDIATLTQVVCGYMKAKDARLLGHFRTDEDTASWLDQIIVDTPLNVQAGDWF